MAFIAAGTTVTATAQTTGSWTPTATGNGFVSGSAYGRYFKIGKLVYVVGRWTIPTGHTGSSGSGIGALSTSQFKITGLPFTAANTSNPVLNAAGSHCAVNGNKLTSGISVVVYHNTSEMRFFGGIVLYNSSYGSFDGSTGGPSTGSEMSVGNAAVGTNDDDKNMGHCSFFYYTD